MSRYFAIQSWVSSHDNEPDYSGQQTGSRHVRSVEIPMFTQHGKANVDWFSDEQIALRSAANKPKSSIKDKILPQFKRLQTLQSQMVELETEYKTTDMTISEYSVLRDIIVAKIQRQEVLYKRAVSVKPIRTDADTFDYQDDMPQDEAEYLHQTHEADYTNPPTPLSNWLDDFIAELPDVNCLKNVLKIALQVTRKVVEFSQKARNYINELKAV